MCLCVFVMCVVLLCGLFACLCFVWLVVIVCVGCFLLCLICLCGLCLLFCVLAYGLYCVLCLFPGFALMRACFVYCVCFACDAMFDVVCHVLFVLCRCVCATCLKRCLRVLFLSDRVMFCGAFAMCGLLCVMCC